MHPLLETRSELGASDLDAGVGFTAATAAKQVVAATAKAPATCYNRDTFNWLTSLGAVLGRNEDPLNLLVEALPEI